MKAKELKIIQISLTYLILALITLSSCEKEDNKCDNSNLLVLFQYDYFNNAWGYVHIGWFVDKKGNVKGYHYPDDWKWTDSAGYIAYDSLIYNYNQTDTLYGQIDIVTLWKKSNLICGTLNGELSDLECPGRDMGQMILSCYYWDSEKNKYKRQFLATKGDCE